MGSDFPSRMPRPGEDPVDWAFETGELPESVYRIIRPNGRAVRTPQAVMASAAERVAKDAATRSAAPVLQGELINADVNPLAFRAAQAGQSANAVAASGGSLPKLFGSSDLPPATASGIDPQVLASIPWQGRHAVAEEPDRAEALAMVAAMSGPDGDLGVLEHMNHPGNQVYEQSVRAWTQRGADWAQERDLDRRISASFAAAKQVRASAADLSDDQLYDALFGEPERERQARKKAEQEFFENKRRVR